MRSSITIRNHWDPIKHPKSLLHVFLQGNTKPPQPPQMTMGVTSIRAWYVRVNPTCCTAVPAGLGWPSAHFTVSYDNMHACASDILVYFHPVLLASLSGYCFCDVKDILSSGRRANREILEIRPRSYCAQIFTYHCAPSRSRVVVYSFRFWAIGSDGWWSWAQLHRFCFCSGASGRVYQPRATTEAVHTMYVTVCATREFPHGTD